MKLRSRNALSSLLAVASLLICLTALEAPARAGTLGSAGEIGEVDLVGRTLEVGSYLLEVSPTSVLLDADGTRLRLEDLSDFSGEAGFTMSRVGTRYLLRTLQLHDPDLDEEEDR